MGTIDHVTLRVGDLDAALALYTRAFELLDFTGERYDGDGFHEWNDFSIASADAAHEPTHGLHIGFAAHSRSQVDAWWRGLTSLGHANEGEPGVRAEYSASYYGGFVLDADGNSIEAALHENTDRATGVIDHVWVRVRDLAGTGRFYSAIAPAVGLRSRDDGDRFVLISESGTISFVSGPPTENLHLALGVDSREAVATFHREGSSAGGADNGAPGERPEYHAGYYAAYLLDPDGNNIEAVFHDRV